MTSLSNAQDIAHYSHPAAIIRLDGSVLAANALAAPLLDNLFVVQPVLLDRIQAEKPFQYILKNGMGLIVTPLDDATGVLLEWQSLSEAQTRLALFQAISQSVNSSLILEDIFDALGEVLHQFIPFTSGAIVILDETQNRSNVLVTLDAYGQAEVSGDTKIFAGYDALIDDLLKNPQAKQLQAPFPQSVLLSSTAPQAVISPLMSKGILIGCIGLSGDSFTPMQLSLLEEASAQLAVAVENARLYWQTQSQAGREFLINQITKAIRQSLEIETILQTTVAEIGKVMGLSRCLISYWGSESELFAQFEYTFPGVAPIAQPHAFSKFEKDLFLSRTDSAQKYNPFVLNDSRSLAAHQALLSAEEIKSLAVFPILLQEKAFVGSISLHQCDNYRVWLGEEIALLKAIAEHVAVAVHQANLFQEKENQRRQLEETLQELKQTQMQLIQSEKMAVLGQFVAGIAHEVNTPLGTIMSNDDTVLHCLEQITVADDKAARYRVSALELLAINRMAGERIQEIVRNLRNFARLDESDLKQADLHEGLESTLLLIQSSLKSNIQVNKHYGNIPTVECFPGLLNQVFMNLLVNAVQSIEAPGTITLRTRYDTDAEQVMITIADTGKGISPDHLPRIFDPGFTTKGVGVGTGLGLALCYKIVEKHHGHIQADSVMGQGTTMTVILPVVQPAAS